MQRVLEARGIRVWRDTAELWPGEDWRAKIRHAITDDALVFIACFSHNSAGRQKSYQREELALAIDQMRLRKPDAPWLIPVRFDDCDIPEYDIGVGRSLASLQRADLFGARSDEATSRLATAVLRILGRQSREPSQSSRASAVQRFSERKLFPVDNAATVGLFVDLENLLYSKPADVSHAQLARCLMTFASSLGALGKAWAVAPWNASEAHKAAEYDFRNAGFTISSQRASFQSSVSHHISNASDALFTSILIYETVELGLNRVVIASGDSDLLIPVNQLLEQNIIVRLVVWRKSLSGAWRRLAEARRSLDTAATKTSEDINFDIAVLEDLILSNAKP